MLAVNAVLLAEPLVERSGEGLRQVESGNVQHYAFGYLLGVLAIAAYYVYRTMH